MERGRSLLRADPAALLLYSLLIFFTDTRFLAALLPAVALHEAGHLVALRLLGRHVRALALELTGLRIDYVGLPETRGEILAAAAGPAAGFLWAGAAFRLGAVLESAILELSGWLSLLLSLFNLLPAPPLDGGRIAAGLFSLRPGGERGERLTRMVALSSACLLTLAGLGLLAVGRLTALLPAGAALLVEQIRTRGR